jgi:hypothetical protein
MVQKGENTRRCFQDAKHLSVRNHLVELIIEACQNFNLRNEVCYLAVNLFDNYLAQELLEGEVLNCVIVTCLTMSQKLLDKQTSGNTLALIRMLEYGSLVEQIRECEIQILSGRFRHFPLDIPTPIIFLRFLFSRGIVGPRDRMRTESFRRTAQNT